MQLSYSRLATFINCGLLYRLRYIEKIPARPKPHLGFGRILHSTLDKFYSLHFDSPTFGNLKDIYNRFWKTGSDAYKKHYDKGLAILKRYYELNAVDYHKAVYVEQPFEIPIGGHVLAGRFDRVDRIHTDDYEIIDYKAAKQVSAQVAVDADLQLGIYALAFKLTTGKLPILSFYFLPENVKVTTRRTEDDIGRLKAGLDAMVDRLIGGEGFEPQESVECKWCDYKRYCPIKTKDPLEIPNRLVQPELILSNSQNG